MRVKLCIVTVGETLDGFLLLGTGQVAHPAAGFQAVMCTAVASGTSAGLSFLPHRPSCPVTFGAWCHPSLSPCKRRLPKSRDVRFCVEVSKKHSPRYPGKCSCR